MKSILIIDNKIDPPHGSPEIVQHLKEQVAAPSLNIILHRGPDKALPANSHFDGVIISGSKTLINEKAPWIESQMEFIRKLHRKKVPTLGICYGEQLIIKALFGDSYVGRGENYELGFIKIFLTEKGMASPLFQGLPQEFYSFCYHYDEVYQLPKGYTLSAYSEKCKVHGFSAPDAPMWGLQFHPEKKLKECKLSIEHIKKENKNAFISEESNIEELFDPEIGKRIFSNFIRQC